MSTKDEAERLAEEWRVIPGYPNCQASSLGRIKVDNIISLGSKNPRGYMIKSLCSKGCHKTYRVHRLIMLAFGGPSDLDVNHKNGIKCDNRLANLEYCTRGDNNRHAFRTGLNYGHTGEDNQNAKLTKAQVHHILSCDETNRALARRFKVSDNLIGHVRAGRAWREEFLTFNPQFLQKGFRKQLAHLIEECGEVLAAAGKTQRFGRNSVNPLIPKEQQETNLNWLKRELLDLKLAIARLEKTICPENKNG